MKINVLYKKFILNFLFFVFIFVIFPVFIVKDYCCSNCANGVDANISTSSNNENSPVLLEKNEELRGVWFSFCEWKEFHNGKTEAEWRETINNSIVPNLKSLNVNNVFLHAVAHGDAFYSSEISPMAQEVTKQYGKVLPYSPFKVFVDILKENGFKVHAWVNPLRVMTDAEFANISSSYLIKNWHNSANKSDFYMKDTLGRFWFNPANPAVIAHIKNVCSEIIDKHPNLDGVHFDDYFYPFDLEKIANYEDKDLKYYEKVKPGIKLEDWRRANVTNLVKEVYSVCHSKNKIFGVSPTGNIKGNYDVMFFDQDAIVQEGCLDYIMPQIYYGFENEVLPFKNAVEIWKDIISKKPKDKKISFYVGLAAYKLGMPEDVHAGSGRYEWKNNEDVIKRQVEFLKGVKEVDGFVYCSYNSFFGAESRGLALKNI